MTDALRIEVLSFDGCPNVDLAMRRAREAACATGFNGEVASVIVHDEEEAVARKFLGSPSVHVDGIDVDGSPSPGEGYGMRCRLYAQDGRIEGAPSVERIVLALRGARGTVDAPVFACTLPPPELRRRRVEVLARVRGKIVRIEETSDGFVFGFARSPDLITELEEFIRFEAMCCSFITMTLADGTDNSIDLRMSAPAEAKPFIRAEFIDVAGTDPSPATRCC